jgi:hypothetical protein
MADHNHFVLNSLGDNPMSAMPSLSDVIRELLEQRFPEDQH